MILDQRKAGPRQAVNFRTDEIGTQQHCRRVAFWADEMAAELGLTSEERKVLRAAALAHHDVCFHDDVLDSLLGDAGVLTRQLFRPTLVKPRPQEVLQHFHQDGSGSNHRAGEMARVLALANRFDEQLEYARYNDADLDALIAAAEECDQPPYSLTRLRNRMRRCDRRDLRDVMPRMPVYPIVVLKLTRLLANDNVTMREVEQVAKGDQVISGKLVLMANSAFYGPATPIRTVSQAIAYVGLETAKRALVACGIQPMYAHSRLYPVWQHSIEAAETAESIARMSGKVDPAEAFLLGLLHDVGELAILLMRAEAHLNIERLRENGCDPAMAQTLVCGFDHAEAGAEILKYWKFADDLVTAVRYHHTPERTASPLASVLYLTEFWTASEEDLPATSRLSAALANTGLTLDQLEAEQPRGSQALAALA